MKKNNTTCYSYRQIQKKLKRNAALFAVLGRILLVLGNLVYLYLKRAWGGFGYSFNPGALMVRVSGLAVAIPFAIEILSIFGKVMRERRLRSSKNCGTSRSGF